MKRASLPLLLGALGLAGALAATLFLYLAASAALERTLDERLRGAGEAAAQLLAGRPPDAARLQALMRANQLEGAVLVDGALGVLADATGPAGRRADLLRVDPERVRRALAGDATVGGAYSLGQDAVMSGYFAVAGASGAADSVLVLEAGRAFAVSRGRLRSALALGALLSLLAAAGLSLVAARWSTAERQRAEAADRAARGEALSRMAAAAAHDIRNPLGVIRGTVELMLERSAASLTARDEEDLRDVLSEVDRLSRLTQDLLDLSPDRPLARARVELAELLEDSARAAEAQFPGVRVRREVAALPPIAGDAGRLRQVFGNLLTNAAQASPGSEIALTASARAGAVRVLVRDQGPGVPAEIRARLFEPFVTSKASGTGLGLAICKRLIEKHGGSVALLDEPGPGAAFEVLLPAEV